MTQAFYKIAISFFIVVFFFLIYQIFKVDESSTLKVSNLKKIISNSKSTDDGVNRHLFLTNEKIRLDEQRSRIQADIIEKQLNNLSTNKDDKKIKNKVEDDWGPTSPTDEATYSQSENETPDETIQRKLYEKKFDETYDESYREAYAKQFVANARKNGYEIKLSDDFRVISVKKIKVPAVTY